MALDEIHSGMGSVGFWGNTPACNLLELLQKFHKHWNHQDNKQCNILLMGQADCRHVLKTFTETDPTQESVLGIQIHIFESSPILYARQLLLMHLAFLPAEVMGIHEKTTQFMEIFGNILIRPQTRKTIRKCAETLIKVVSDENFRSEILPMINLDGLKHRERDMIAEILKFWMDSPMSAADMQALWDARLRTSLSSRYDTRMGVFDWDYQMRMIEKNSDTKIIHVKEYKNWRNSGLAFTQYENDYNQANVTFLAGKHRGYQGDMLIGPFISYGIMSEDKRFFEKANHEYKKRSQDVTFHTIHSILSILSSNKNPKISVHFLPFDASTNLWRKQKFIEKFDFLLVSNFIGHQITPELIKLMMKDGIVVMDRTKYIWYFREENDKAYEEKVLELGDLAGLGLCKQDSKEYLSLELKCQEVNDINEESVSN